MKTPSLIVLLICYQSRIALSWIPHVTTKSFLSSLPASIDDTTESLTMDPFSLKKMCRGPAGSFAEQYYYSLSDPEGFWSAAASTLFWFKRPDKILDYDIETKLSRWFVGGQINVCYNALDLHVEHGGRADQVALIYDSPVTCTKKTFTYKELLDDVSRFAAVLVDEYDLKCGDRAVIYMPMIPEAAVAIMSNMSEAWVDSIVDYYIEG